ncbi:MaoC family dehydratase [Marine Group I thaumarchaeote]|jgi:3-hydroxybutyryl-CoA dehydratase|uniref:MaoC family dehydratase n=1 Tax=Marine Group I thaumarchaeote TaxID=2511932 RepID=A0A7K4NQP7_9ARCH|nr:MaoC family dehydratase [Marine Group I thaumarchaeote]
MSEKPSEYSFDEIELGMQKSFKVDISKNMLDVFGRDTGDYNPLHMSEEYASSTSFKKRVCSGMFLASFFSRLVGMYLPGKHALHISQSLTFVNPCFIGETITVEGKVIDKSPATKIIKLETTITNESGKRVIDGKARVIVRDD